MGITSAEGKRRSQAPSLEKKGSLKRKHQTKKGCAAEGRKKI